MAAVKNLHKNVTLQYIVLGLVLSTLPLLSSAGVMRVATLTIIAGVMFYSIAALGLNLLLGFSGLVSLGVAGFMGLGAYVAAYVYADMGWGFGAAMLLAVIVPAALGIVVGLISLRSTGIYLGIMTLCVSEMLLETFRRFNAFTNGMSGKNIRFPSILGNQLSRESVFIVVVIALIATMIFMHHLVKGHAGRAFHAMRGSEAAAQAMGVNLVKYRLIAFAISTAMAGLAGATYVFYIRSSFPTTWDLELSLWIVAAVVIGGFRSIYGTLLGCFVIFAVTDVFIKNIPIIGDIASLPFVINGVLIIVVIMLYPQGLARILFDIKQLAVGAYAKLKGSAA